MKRGDTIKISTTRSCGGSMGVSYPRPKPRHPNSFDPSFMTHLLESLDRAIEQKAPESEGEAS